MWTPRSSPAAPASGPCVPCVPSRSRLARPAGVDHPSPREVMAVVPGAVLLVAVRPSTLDVDQRLRWAGAPLVRLTLHWPPLPAFPTHGDTGERRSDTCPQGFSTAVPKLRREHAGRCAASGPARVDSWAPRDRWREGVARRGWDCHGGHRGQPAVDTAMADASLNPPVAGSILPPLFERTCKRRCQRRATPGEGMQPRGRRAGSAEAAEPGSGAGLSRGLPRGSRSDGPPTRRERTRRRRRSTGSSSRGAGDTGVRACRRKPADAADVKAAAAALRLRPPLTRARRRGPVCNALVRLVPARLARSHQVCRRR